MNSFIPLPVAGVSVSHGRHVLALPSFIDGSKQQNARWSYPSIFQLQLSISLPCRHIRTFVSSNTSATVPSLGRTVASVTASPRRFGTTLKIFQQLRYFFRVLDLLLHCSFHSPRLNLVC
jgi:hypothetical protein